MDGSKASSSAGLTLAAVTAAAAWQLRTLPVWPFTVDGGHPVDVVLIAIILGLCVRNFLPLPALFHRGVQFSVRNVLPLAIVLLGAKLDFFDVLRISRYALLINVLCVGAALGFTIWLCARANVARTLGLLIAVGTAVCGGTAIAVTAPVIEADDSETAFAVATITLLGLISIISFPLVGHALSLTQVQFGIWAGTAIHATPQVMAAAFAYGPEAGETAVVVKLVRVLLLAPIVVIIGALHTRAKRRQHPEHVAATTPFFTVFPPFVFGFLLLAIANTLQWLPTFTVNLERGLAWDAGQVEISVAALAGAASSVLVTVAMAGVGLSVHLRDLAAVGVRALLVGFVAALALALFSLVVQGALT